MTSPIRIPPSEWGIMEILWNESPLSAAEIAERLPVDSGNNVKAVRAFLDRLLQKEAVTRRKIHGMYVFEPLIRREDSLRRESRTFLERFFQGNPISMISHFVENEPLDEEALQRLSEILEKQKRPPQ